MQPVTVQGLDGRSLSLSTDDLEGLRTSLAGAVILPDDPEYAKARTIWNGMIDRKPALIAQCMGVADVIACVRFAAERGIALSIKGGGHNIAGLALQDGGFLMDMSRMRGVWVDKENRIAHAQAGCLLGDVDRETQVHGLAAALGFVSKTGIAGLTLGGGFGYLTRRFGWTCDTVQAFHVVTAKGELVRAASDENPDLFWGLRGGGGNFGVVTSIDYNLFPVGPEILGGAIAWRGQDAPAVLEMYRSLIQDAPRELQCTAILRKAPPAPWLPEDVHGEPVIVLLVCYTGPLDGADEVIAPIKNFGSPVGDVVQRRPYASQQSLLDATQPNGRRYYWKSEYLPGLPPELAEIAMQRLDTMPSSHSAIIFFPVDGALNDAPEDQSPMGNRDARVVLNIAGAWDYQETDEANIAWARDTWNDSLPFSTGGTYINFLTEDEGRDRMRAAYGEHYDRLVEVKTAWDPGNFFRNNKNIPPA